MNPSLTLPFARPVFYFRPRMKRQTIPLFNETVGYLAGVTLTDEEVMRFQAIYEQETGISLNFAMARAKATKLMTFAHVLLRYCDVSGRQDERPE